MATFQEQLGKIQELLDCGFILAEEYESRKSQLMRDLGIAETACASPAGLGDAKPQPPTYYEPLSTAVTSGGGADAVAPAPAIEEPAQPVGYSDRKSTSPSGQRPECDQNESTVHLRRLQRSLVDENDSMRVPAEGQCTVVLRSCGAVVQTEPAVARATTARELLNALGLGLQSRLRRFHRDDGVEDPPDAAEEQERHGPYVGTEQQDALGHYEDVEERQKLKPGIYVAAVTSFQAHRTRGPMRIVDDVASGLVQTPAWCSLPQIPKVPFPTVPEERHHIEPQCTWTRPQVRLPSGSDGFVPRLEATMHLRHKQLEWVVTKGRRFIGDDFLARWQLKLAGSDPSRCLVCGQSIAAGASPPLCDSHIDDFIVGTFRFLQRSEDDCVDQQEEEEKPVEVCRPTEQFMYIDVRGLSSRDRERRIVVKYLGALLL
eukprot:m51a1_g13866 hypothetical protein (431) ;mRNA; r:610450-611866